MRTARVLAAFLLGCGALAGEHPRLFFTANEVPALREKVKKEPWKSMFEKLRADLDKNNWGQPTEKLEPYDESTIVQRAAFLYVLTGDDAYARKARSYIEKRMADKAWWCNPGAKGLSLYWHGSKIAMAYDWCFGAPSWDEAFCRTVSAELKKHGDVILKNGGKEQNTDAASNWQGGRFGSAGLCFLATDEAVPDGDLAACYSKVDRFCRENMAEHPKSRGWNSEGLGYTYYPMGNFVGPFGIAMARRAPDKDLRKLACVGWTYWTTYAVQTKALGYIRPDFGDDNPGTNGEGVYGQAFYYCDAKLLPGLVQVYDRMWGLQGNKSFDPARGGTIWSILYHPGDAVAAQDPLSLPEWRSGFVDLGGNGYLTYRNRYADEDDSVAQLYVKLRGNRGHSGPDALSFRILGQGTAWAVGGGRYGKKHAGGDAYWLSMNTLYPQDPDNGMPKPNGNSGQIVGTPVLNGDGGGHVVASIAQNNVHTRNQKRWFVVDFGKSSGADAVYVIGDTSDDGRFWQLCSYEKNKIVASGNAFTITAENGATMKGTVLHPAGDPKFKIGTRPRGSDFVSCQNNTFVTCQSEDGCFLVVLTAVGQGGKHPAVTLTGTWSKTPDAVIAVGGYTVSIKGDDVK